VETAALRSSFLSEPNFIAVHFVNRISAKPSLKIAVLVGRFQGYACIAVVKPQKYEPHDANMRVDFNGSPGDDFQARTPFLVVRQGLLLPASAGLFFRLQTER
jgi:hypothetical protein